MKDFDWRLLYLVIHRCTGDAKAGRIIDHVRSRRHFEVGEELLQELLDSLLSSAWLRKASINDTSSCKAWNFKNSEAGDEDRDLLGSMVSVVSLEEFEPRALLLSERYAQVPAARAGLLIHVGATVDSGRCKSLPFYFLFKCDFEDARQLSDAEIIAAAQQVIVNKPRKFIAYPYFDGFQQDSERVKVGQPATSHFAEMLNIRPPTGPKQLLQRELHHALTSRFSDRYDDYLVSLPPPKRELFGEERFIPLNDLLPATEAAYVTALSCKAAEENHDRPIKVSIQIDTNVKVQANLAGLGKSFFFARKGDLSYMIIRGEHFTGSGQLTGLDFLKAEQLDELLPRVMEDVAGGVDPDAPVSSDGKS